MKLSLYEPGPVTSRPLRAAKPRPLRLTIIHPCIGRRAGDARYIRTWQMEPLPAATVAGLTPAGVDVRFHDDRMEPIPLDEPTVVRRAGRARPLGRRPRPRRRVGTPLA